MSELVSMVLLEDPPFESEGEIVLGQRLDQVIEVNEFPADIAVAALLEVRLDPGVDGNGVTVDLSLKSDDFDLALGSHFIPTIARGDEWPFPPDIAVWFSATVSVPAEAEAYLTVRFDHQIRQTKWLRVVKFEVVPP